MKKVTLILMMLLFSVALFSCKSNGKQNDGANSNSNSDSQILDEVKENYIFKSGSSLCIVASKAESDGNFADSYGELVQSVYSAIAYGEADVNLSISSDSAAAADHEIIIGESSRPLSVKAYQQLSRMDIADGDDAYVICSDGHSLAIAYTPGEDYKSAEITIEKFIDEYINGKSSLVLEENHIEKISYNAIEYYSARDEQLINEEWAALYKEVVSEMSASLGETEAKEYADSLVASLKKLYTMYDDSVVTWLADLYDPAICVCTAIEGEDRCLGTKYCGGAGFYFSNSGRNTLGYMPDIESTLQALSFLSATGMLKLKNGALTSAFPAGEPQKMVRFVKALQDEQTGYFYHPQWEVETLWTSRVARDLNYGTQILRFFGAKPTYDTPAGVEGDGILYDGTEISSVAPASKLTGRLSHHSVASLVSYVKPTASYSPDYMLSKEGFIEYLEALDVKNDSYAAGNELSSIANQLISRDKYLASVNADYRLVDLTIDHLNACQNKLTGTWDYKTEGDTGYTPYYANDGVLKIATFYNAVKRPMNYASLAVKNAIYAISVDYTPGHVCNVYNTWFAVSAILGNITAYGDPAEAAALRAELRALAPEAIEVTLDKMLLFKKDDGSFSYFKENSSSGSQGAAVAVPNTNEGDLNATAICTYGLVDYIFQALGFRDYMVSLYTDSDRQLFKSIISDLSPVMKSMEIDPSEPVTFDDGTLGNTPLGVLNYGSASGSAKAAFTTIRRNADDYAAKLDSPSGCYNVVEVSTVSGLGGRIFVFGGDFRIAEAPTDGYILQINMGKNEYTTTVYMLAFKMEGGRVTIWDATTVDGKANNVNTRLAEAELGEWFNIRAEYYVGDHDTVRIKFYFNDELVAVTDNYYDQSGEKLKNGVGTPNSGFDRTRIATMSAYDVVVEMDNLSGYKLRGKYKPTDDSSLILNVDAPDEEENIYFDGDEVSLPNVFDITDGKENLSVTTQNGNSAMKYDGNSGAEIIIPATLRDASGKCASINFDLELDSISSGRFMYISLLNRCIGDLYAGAGDYSAREMFNLAFTVINENGESYFAVYEYADKNVGKELYRDLTSTKSFNIRLDYFAERGTAVIYVNGSLPIVTKSVNSFASRYNFGKLKIAFTDGVDSTILMDNLKVELGTRDFDKDMAPGIASEYHTFENGYGNVSVSDENNAYVADTSAGKALSVNGSAEVKVPVLDRSPVFNCYIYEAKLTVNNGSVRFKFTDAQNKCIFALDAVVSGSNVNIFEVGKNVGSDSYKRYSYVLASAQANKEFTLRIELFRADSLALIYVDGKLCDVTTVIYSTSDEAADYKNLLMTSDSQTSYTVDDIKAETLYSFYILPDSINKNNGESASEKLTYNDSSIVNLPTALTGEFYSAKAEYKIKQMLKNINGTEEYDKVAVFEKNGNAYDYVWVDSSAQKNASMYVFESDMMIDTDIRGNYAYQMLLGDKSNRSKFAYYLLIYIDKEGKIGIRDASSLNGDGNHKRWTSQEMIAEVGEWFNLRIEYYSGDKNTVRIKVYVNGELLGVSDNYYGWHAVDSPIATPTNFFDRVQFYVWKGQTDLYLDNTLITSGNGTCTDDVTFSFLTP